MNVCIFCKIVKGELPSYKVWEDDNHLAFLDIHPVKKGHILVVPKKHVDYFFNMDDQDLANISLVCKPLAKTLVNIFEPKTGKVALLFVGTGVEHVHAHLFPLDAESDINPANAYDASASELEETQAKIHSASRN